MDFRNDDKAADVGLAEGGLFAPADGTAGTETGGGPAITMTDKTDAGSAELVETLGAAALAGAVTGLAKAAKQDDSKSVQPRRFTIVTDPARDALLTDFGKDTLDDRYLLP
ncbi:MAG: ribonucleotide-diphosphate reductase subunit alpha, partial [Sphingomonadales bacterium]|nr:ribonucleotide-diphosphate reductase subunit alpha [Sphingomonadales bacterium]